MLICLQDTISDFSNLIMGYVKSLPEQSFTVKELIFGVVCCRIMRKVSHRNRC